MIKYYAFKKIEKSIFNKINKKKIKKNNKFLYESLNNTIEYYANLEKDIEYISYFGKVYFEISMSDEKLKPNEYDFLGCHIFDDKETSDLSISQNLRGSSTLKVTDNNCYESVDVKVVFAERSFAFISKFNNYNQKSKFEKIYILYMLAHAYNLYTEMLLLEVSNSYKNNDFERMIKLRKEIYIFDLNCFFSNPVYYERHQLNSLWCYVESIYKVEKKYIEVKTQIKDFVSLIEVLLKEEENKKISQRTFYLTLIGSIIALFSLFGAYKDFKEVFGIKSPNNIIENKR